MSADISGSELVSTWGAQRTSMSTANDQPPYIQEAPRLSMPSPIIVPFARYSSRIRPHRSVDERQLEQYQSAKHLSWSPNVTQTSIPEEEETNESQSGRCKNFISSKFLISILIGIVLCGIPMGIMTNLYVQAKASSDDSTHSVGTTTSNYMTSSALPSQCTTNTSLSDITRTYNYTGCCLAPDCTMTAGWYRITGASGTQLLTNPINVGYCGQNCPAWFNGSLPSTPGTTISGVVCANVGGTICPSSYSTTISVTNCNGYYVFFLVPFTACNVRYCTM